MSIKRSDFKHEFVFGTATSAFQIEGAVESNGRRSSIWDDFCKKKGAIRDGSTADIACDHFHLYEHDLDLIKAMGLSAYRFSISWPRVLSDTQAVINQAGIDFYDRLIDGMLERDITPYVTLYHWDLPSYWQEKGGWLNRDTAKAFAEYSAKMVERFGDRIPYWFTHNEMWCTAFLGYEHGIFAPGKKSLKDALQVAHHILVSHGLAVEAMRDVNPSIAIGIAPNYLPSYSATEKEEDKKAAATFDGYFNRWFLDPLTGRGYPEDMQNIYRGILPSIEPADMEKIAIPLDLIGVNYYNSNWYKHAVNPPFNLRKVEQDSLWRTEDRDVYAKGLYDTLERFNKEYKFENIYITENGAAVNDIIELDDQGHKRIFDQKRIRFFEEHFEQTKKALDDGISVKGYFLWSLMDNFEWNCGYSLRYGLYYVDFATQERIAKDSALWLAAFMQK